MATPYAPGTRTFATDEARQASKRSFIRIVKLLGVPLLLIMGFMSGTMLTDAGLPRPLGVACSILLGPGLPLALLRGCNRRLRFYYTLHPDVLEVGPAKHGWRAPYIEVALIRESYFDEQAEPYLEVIAGKRSAKVLLSTDDMKACADALVARCPWAVRIDNQGKEQIPAALQGAPGTPEAERALGSLDVVRQRYAQAVTMFAIFFVASLALAGFGVAGGLGARKVAIGPAILALMFGLGWWFQFRQLKSWGRLCDRFAATASAAVEGTPPPSSRG